MKIDKYFATKNGAYDKQKLIECMKEYGDTETPFFGKNEDGETVCVHVAQDGIIVDTYQSNGWLRKNYYNAEGNQDGETFDGRWDK